MEIELKNIWYSYDNTSYVLKNVSISFSQPGVYLIIGPNGAGKTTLLKIASLIYRPTKGCVVVDGRDFWALDEEERNRIRMDVVYVHDRPILVRGSTRYNIELGLRLRGAVNSFRDTVDVYIERYGLKEYEDRPVNKLSSGQAKIVSIIRAFVLKPRVLMLDEPFTHLDIERLNLLINDIAELSRESIVVITSHYMFKELGYIARHITEIIGGEIKSYT